MSRKRRLSLDSFQFYTNEESQFAYTEPNYAGTGSVMDMMSIDSLGSSAFTKVQKKKRMYSYFMSWRRLWEYLIFIISITPYFEISFIFIFLPSISFVHYLPFILFDFLYLFDLHVSAHTVQSSNGIEINEFQQIKQWFGMRTILLQVISAIPLSWIGIMLGNKYLYLILSIPRVLRFRRALIAVRVFRKSLIFNSWLSALIPLLSLLFMCVHTFACLFYLCAYFESIEKSWIGFKNFDYLTPPKLYVVSIYFVMTTILAIGFGDLTPQTSQETALVIFIQIIGVIVNSYIIGSLVSLLIDPIDSSFITRFKEFTKYLQFKKVPTELEYEILNYFQMRYSENKGTEEPSEVFKYIPDSIRNRLKLDMCRDSLLRIGMFRTASEQFLLHLATVAYPIVYTPGDIIIKEGSITPTLYILKKGVIEVSHNGVPVAAQSCDTGTAFGELELFVTCPRRITVKALTFVSGWTLDREDIQFCIAHKIEMRKEMLDIAKRTLPDHHKEIRSLLSIRALQEIRRSFSDSDSSDSDLAFQIHPSDSSEDSFEDL